jgi:uncharacterized protein
MKDDLLVIFAREPVAGKVKTRLAGDVGYKAAARLYGLMMSHVVRDVLSPCYDIWLCKTPESREAYFREMVPGAVISNQVEGDLGARMSYSFRSGFAAKYKRICMIGTDCPGISTHDIIQAFDILNKYELVLGPSFDGGYYLIGLSKFHPELFEGISWSTGSVLSETIGKASFLDIGYASLCARGDIDDIAGLTEYIRKNPGTELAAAFEDASKRAAVKKED